MKTLDINKMYDKLREYSNYDFYDFYLGKDLDEFYWFDKKHCKFVHNNRLNKKKIADTDRYVKFIRFEDSELVDFYIDFSKDERVKDYFLNPIDESMGVRMRIFADWNNLYLDENYAFAMYNEYSVFTDAVVAWCKENGVDYSFNKKEPPKEYYEAEQLSDSYEWIIPPYKR